jgi:hypothetical protein
MSAGYDSIRRREYTRKNSATPGTRISMNDQVAKTANRAEDSYLQRRLLAYSKEYRSSQAAIQKDIGSNRNLDKRLRTRNGQPLGSHVDLLGLTRSGGVSSHAPVSLYYDPPRTAQPASRVQRQQSHTLSPPGNRGQNRVTPPQNLSPFSMPTGTGQSKVPRHESGHAVYERARSFYSLNKK